MSTEQAEWQSLLEKLTSLPLAVAQAGAYLQETGIGVQKYIQLYETKWKELMAAQSSNGTPLKDYPNRSIMTTWAISYELIRDKQETAANMLLLWSFLGCKDLRYEAFLAACKSCRPLSQRLRPLLGPIADNELAFIQTMRLLRQYSLIEDVEEAASYAMHPLVHEWVYNCRAEALEQILAPLAVLIIGFAAPRDLSQNSYAIRLRLLPSAQACVRWVQKAATANSQEDKAKLNWLNSLWEASALFQIVETVYAHIRRDEAQQLYVILLDVLKQCGQKESYPYFKVLTDVAVIDYRAGRLEEAEENLTQALRGLERIVGIQHNATLKVLTYLGKIHLDRGETDQATEKFDLVLRTDWSAEAEKGSRDISSAQIDVMNIIATAYEEGGQLEAAVKLREQALSRHRAFSQQVERHTNPSTSASTSNNTIPMLFLMDKLARSYAQLDRVEEAKEMLANVVSGYMACFGRSSRLCREAKEALEELNLK